MAVLENAAGSGSFKNKIDETDRLWTRTVSETEQNEQSTLGEAFTISSGFVNLSGTAESALFYLKNNSERDLLITRFIASCRDSTNGTQNHARLIIYYNPTGMTGGSSNSLNIVNLNFGSSKNLVSDSEIGANAATLDNPSVFGGFVVPLESLTSESASIVLPQGSSIGVTAIAPTGNTSMDIGVGISCHLSPL